MFSKKLVTKINDITRKLKEHKYQIDRITIYKDGLNLELFYQFRNRIITIEMDHTFSNDFCVFMVDVFDQEMGTIYRDSMVFDSFQLLAEEERPNPFNHPARDFLKHVLQSSALI